MTFVTRLDDCPPGLPSPPVDAEPVIAGGWFPDVDPAAIRKAHRVRDEISGVRLREALLGAIITVGNDLELWRLTHQLLGRSTLADVPAPKIDGRSRLEILYTRAVALYAKAEIVERYRDTDATAAGDRRLDALDGSIGELRRDAAFAVRDLLGRGRTTVELI